MPYNLSNDVVGVSRAPYRAALVSAPSSLKHGKQAAGVSEILGGMGFRASAGLFVAVANVLFCVHGESLAEAGQETSQGWASTWTQGQQGTVDYRKRTLLLPRGEIHAENPGNPAPGKSARNSRQRLRLGG